MRYVREPDVITAEPKVTTRIRSSGGVTQILRLMVLGLGQPRMFNPVNDFVFLPYRYVLLVSPAPF